MCLSHPITNDFFTCFKVVCLHFKFLWAKRTNVQRPMHLNGSLSAIKSPWNVLLQTTISHKHKRYSKYRFCELCIYSIKMLMLMYCVPFPFKKNYYTLNWKYPANISNLNEPGHCFRNKKKQTKINKCGKSRISRITNKITHIKIFVMGVLLNEKKKRIWQTSVWR